MHPGLILEQPRTGFQVASVHSILECSLMKSRPTVMRNGSLANCAAVAENVSKQSLTEEPPPVNEKAPAGTKSIQMSMHPFGAADFRIDIARSIPRQHVQKTHVLIRQPRESSLAVGPSHDNW